MYAKPEDLPSFPSIGLKKDDAAASAAATLGWANQKTVTLWTPDKSASASAAAVLAKDYKMAPVWKPERSSAGSKAATLAAENAARTEQRSSAPAKTWENSAANQAFQAGRNQPQTTDQPSMTLSRQQSMRAAKGAMARGARQRSQSGPLTPPPSESYPDSANAAANALNAATLAHKPIIIRANQVDIPAAGAGSVPVTKMNRQMYTSNPPVKLEVDERNHEASLRASAVAMAKQMYAHQQKIIDAAKEAAPRDQGLHTQRPQSADSSIDEPRPMQFNNLQEAAYKLAQERLARLHDEHQKNRDYQEYYGSPTSPRKGTMMNKLRRRASSDGVVDEDRKRSQQIRQQMSMFSTKISEVDEQKRTKDREALLAAAQRNVKASLQGMDEKMYRETGRVNPSMLNEWEMKAHATAQSRSEARKNDNAGKIDVGGGMFMDQKDVDDIAASRVQPVLDEINVKAEAERERQAEIKAEKDKIAALKAEVKEQKSTAKAEEKERQALLKKQEKEEKERQAAIRAEEREKHAALRAEERGKKVTIDTDQDPTLAATSKSSSSPEESPGSPSVKVRNWIKSRFSRPRAKSTSTADKEEQQQQGPGFIGGHALTRLHADGIESMTSLENSIATSMREVALAGKARDTPSPNLSVRDSVSQRDASNRDSRFIELIN